MEGRKSIIEDYNSKIQEENETLKGKTLELLDYYDAMEPMATSLKEEFAQLQQEKRMLTEEIALLEKKKAKTEQDADLVKYKADIERYLPDVPDLLFWGQYCATIGFPDSYIHRILSFEKVGFKGVLYSPQHKQDIPTDGSVATLERNPNEKHSFELKIDGVSVFQWFKDMFNRLLSKMGFQQSQPEQSRSAHI